MKNILLSSAVALLLGMSGCGDNETTAAPVVTSKALDSVKSIQRAADATYVVAWAKDADVELLIAGGADSSKFEIVNSATGGILKFKNDITPTYVVGGDNEYIVEINAKDVVKNLTKRVGTYKVKVPRPTVIADTTAPVITTSDATFHFTDTTTNVMLTATDNVTVSNAIVFSIPSGSSMFTLSGATLSPEFNSGTNSVVVTAQDAAGNQATKTITVDVNVTGNQALVLDDVENGRSTWAEADAACTAKGWRLPTFSELRENNVTIFNNITSLNIDSDFNQSNGVVFNSVIWSSTPVVGGVQGLWYSDGTVAGAKALDRAKTDTSFRLCVRP